MYDLSGKKKIESNFRCKIEYSETEGLLINHQQGMLSLMSIIVYKTAFKKLLILNELMVH